MLEHLPVYLSVLFCLIAIASLILLQWTILGSDSRFTKKKAGITAIVLSAWLIIQAILALKNTYNPDTDALPPKIILFGILPMIIAIVSLFVSVKGRTFMDSLPLERLTYLNLIRIPVEIGLYLLCLNKVVPEIMTFEGRNFDILAGITAPFIAWYGIRRGKLNPKLILLWNVICLALLINIVFTALLSAPSPLQKFAFDQPNIALTNFPFVCLPTLIVPIVFFGHLVSIRQLLRKI
ncbi:hypothetical protein QG516_04560 [Pedobacter gandavensis]|uniref:hypothetical protein n=1 Tax=Pedobacter gandavensis TaxID=2679963 RepID=UPI0024788A47|nr:hypothetical protein [Pedobacter gandavensis]WGQ10926.1 hypothetical protein QG516_04560 [Pedobacter gandavensis]